VTEREEPVEVPATRPDDAPVVDGEKEREGPLTFALDSGTGEDPVQLAELLLLAWVDRDPTPLENWLNEPEHEISSGCKRLVAAFWQAAVGAHDSAEREASELEGVEGVTTTQLALLRAAGDPAPNRPIPAAVARRDPLARSMRMVLLEERASRAAERGDWALAARSRSDLIQLEVGAPWAPHREALRGWVEALNRAQAMHRLHPDGEWPSLETEVQPNDSLSVIRQRVLAQETGLLLCVGLIREVNDTGRYIHPGDLLRIPTDPPNVLVDLDARLLLYRHGTEVVAAWEVGIGMEGHETPLGSYVAGEKIEDPPWMRAGHPPLPFGHPENPLGTRWIAWLRDGEKTTYGVHGTWEPDGVGGRVSQGCVRMRNEGVETLFELLPVGSEILVQP